MTQALMKGLRALLERHNLSLTQAQAAMTEITRGQATPAQVAAFLTALGLKGETSDEIAGCARALRQCLVSVKTRVRTIVDTCGTGGDGKSSFNVSTAAAFVVAGTGLTVAKHGNRSVSSRCGSADVLETLGINPEMAPALAEEALHKIGIAFLFAPRYHPAMRHAMPVRRELGFRTIFNILGPLANPARANAQLIGVPEARLVRTLGQALLSLKEKRGVVVHTDGWDEITLTKSTMAVRLHGGSLISLSLSPRDFGLPAVRPRDLMGGDARTNSEIILKILGGRSSPKRHVVVANAACAIWIAGGPSGKEKISLKESVKIAEHSIDSRAALEKLKKLRALSPARRG